MLSSIGWGTYIFFAVWLFIGALFVYFFVPETRGKTLEEMDAAFGSHTSQEDLDELERVQKEVGLLDLLSNESGWGYTPDEKSDVSDRVEHINI